MSVAAWEIRHGDALALLREMPSGSFDGFVTDPPYAYAGGSTNGMTSQADGQFFEFWLRSVLGELQRVIADSGCGFVFCDWRTVGSVARCMRPNGDRQTALAWSVSQALVWDRESIGLGSPFRNSFEMIAFARGPRYKTELPRTLPTVVRHRWPYGEKQHHGAEKPVALCEQLIRWCVPNGGRIIDPFAGSGTTVVAAQRVPGVSAVGLELSEDNVEVARRRIAGPLFAEVAP